MANKEYQPKQIGEMLGLPQGGRMPQANIRSGQDTPIPTGGANRFLLPISQCEFTLTCILEQLQRDPWSVASDKRSLRCTGVAMYLSLFLKFILFKVYRNRIIRSNLSEHGRPNSLI